MIKEAFASDNVFTQFQAQKEAEIQADAPKEVDLTLPGWGSWAGQGLPAPAMGRVIKKVPGLDPKKRRDAQMKHVIIHEKRAKKVGKLMVDKVPFPFKSREEYERSLNTPVGKEWNPQTNYVSRIRPRIQVKVGSIIDPIKFVKKDYTNQ